MDKPIRIWFAAWICFHQFWADALTTLASEHMPPTD